MDYSRFEALKENNGKAGISEQERMETFFRDFCSEACSNPERINERMAPEFVSCSAEGKELCLSFRPQIWQANPSSYLHGGMIATAVDIAAGLLTKYLIRSNDAVTVEMNCSYLRAIPIDTPYRVTAKAVKTGRSLYFLNVQADLFDDRKPAVTATLVYMILGH